MTHEELAERLEQLRDEATPVDTDIAVVLAILARMLHDGEDLGRIARSCLEGELQGLRRRREEDAGDLSRERRPVRGVSPKEVLERFRRGTERRTAEDPHG